jgi:hypothetical protein
MVKGGETVCEGNFAFAWFPWVTRHLGDVALRRHGSFTMMLAFEMRVIAMNITRCTTPDILC